MQPRHAWSLDTQLYVSSYYDICVRILLYMCPHITMCVLLLIYMCPHTSSGVVGTSNRASGHAGKCETGKSKGGGEEGRAEEGREQVAGEATRKGMEAEKGG